MSTITLRRIKDDFIVTGPDIAPAKFKSGREAKDWCASHYPGSPIHEIGADLSKRGFSAAWPGHSGSSERLSAAVGAPPAGEVPLVRCKNP